MSSPLLGPARARRPHGRRYVVVAAALLALAGCGGARADLSVPGPARTPTDAKAAGKSAPPPRPRAVVPEKLAEPPQMRRQHLSADPRVVQKRLASLGYLPVDAATGSWDARTAHAVQAFQAWEGLARDGIVGPQTLAALENGNRPTPAASLRARHVEVHREKGLTLLVEGRRVVRALHSSSGGGTYATPAGRFSIFRKEPNSWSVPYRVWLPYASYFNGGIAFHGYPDVPAHPASHGCVRLPLAEAAFAYAFMSVGTPVAVY